MPRSPIALSLALQGGGAHGAYTWGALDGLLASGRSDIRAASGASAGAINAALLAQGLMDGGPEGARAALAGFWSALSTWLPTSAAPAGVGGSPEAAPWLRSLWWMGRQWPGMGQALLGYDPLRRLIGQHVDTEALRRHCPLRLFIAATDARTAGLRVFREHELTVEVLLASACLPQWTPAVEHDGSDWWDGGFAANPPLLPLLFDGGCRDLLAVMLMPQSRPRPARSAREVEARVLELGFTTPLLAEARTLAEVARRLGRWDWSAAARTLRRSRWHVIDARPALGAIPAETRLLPEARFIGMLRDLGREQALAWTEPGAHRCGRPTAELDDLIG